MLTLELQPSDAPAATSLDLTSMIDEVRVLMEAAYGESQMQIDWRLPRMLPPVLAERYGLIQVFRTVAPDGDVEYWATNRLTMTEPDREAYAARAWLIETYHRGLKQLTGVEAGQFRLGTSEPEAPRTLIFMPLFSHGEDDR